jgi:hypothetical protein
MATPVMRSFGEDLKNVADEMAAPPELAQLRSRSGADVVGGLIGILIGLVPIPRKGPPPDVAHLVLQHRHWPVRNLNAADRNTCTASALCISEIWASPGASPCRRFAA